MCVCVCVCWRGVVPAGPAASEAISVGSLEAPGMISRLRIPALRVPVLLNLILWPYLWPGWVRKGERELGGKGGTGRGGWGGVSGMGFV